MSLAILMVMAAVFLGPFTAALAKATGKKFDNHAPRAWFEAQEGWRKRADWAQRNHYEAFAPFAASVALALAAGASAHLVDRIAVGFIVARLVYTGFYLADMPSLRSFAWVAGLGLTLWLYVIAARAYG